MTSWKQINNRRYHLITKKHGQGLTSDEATELDKLQEIATKRTEKYSLIDLDPAIVKVLDKHFWELL